MESQSRNKLVSGIEPVDELLGGLERGQLYLVHGEASGKSLFGIKLLIEGLKRGENGALVIRYSPEDAVRRFARLGYDCLEDVYSGRLVILEYSDDIIQKIGRLRELTPVLRELEWLLGETRPSRLILDPITSVLAGAEGDIETRARQFAEWARSFGATVVMIANGSNQEIVRCFTPLVSESFRFDLRESGARAARFIAFEKSPDVPDQAIEVDPSRGVFLLGRAYDFDITHNYQTAPQPPSVADLESIKEELRAARSQVGTAAGSTLHVDPVDEGSSRGDRQRGIDTTELVSERASTKPTTTRELTPPEEKQLQARKPDVTSRLLDSTSMTELDLGLDEPFTAGAPPTPPDAADFNELSNLLDDLTGSTSPLDLDLTGPGSIWSEPGLDSRSLAAEERQPASEAYETVSSLDRDDRAAPSPSSIGGAAPRPQGHSRASDLKIDSAIAARAVELLLRPPETDFEFAAPKSRSEGIRNASPREPLRDGDVHARDFNVLIIEDDAETCDLVTQTLSDYTLEIVHDGVSGLAKLISFKPDLVVLDFDLPIIDGFKVLTLIRSALNVPIIIVSGSRMRAIDRVMASELGADYYLTKPFSAKELKHKARQLIARYRGIDSWIRTSPAPSAARKPSRESEATATAPDERAMFIPYEEFEAEVEKRVRAAMDNGSPFSIVGCRVPSMTANGGGIALQLFDIVRGLARDSDLTSTNPRNDIVALLPNAESAGARAFAGRLRQRVMEELKQEPALWMRSFPDLEESTEAAEPADKPPLDGALNRRSSDNTAQDSEGQQTNQKTSRKADPRESFIDLLENL